MTPAELKDKVDTIVVLMMENRSFDNVLGYLRHPDFGNRPDIDGIEDLNNPDYVNINSDGQGKAPFWMPDSRLISDLPHGADEVHRQLNYAPLLERHLMTGFVAGVSLGELRTAAVVSASDANATVSAMVLTKSFFMMELI